MKLFSYLIIALSAVFLTVAHAACSTVDSVPRIITLSPHLAALVDEAGAGDRLIAVSASSTFPVRATSLPIIADAHGIDVERIVALHPDVIFAWQDGTPAAQIRELQSLHQRVEVIDINHLTDIPRALKKIACVTGANATPAINAFNKQLAHLQTRYAHAARVSVFFQVWTEPVMTVSDASIISDAIHVCGGRNVFEHLPGIAPVVSVESVLTANPDVMVGDYAGWDRVWQSWDQLTAVQHHYLFTLPNGALSQPDARILQGVIALCHDIELARAGKVS